jgi:hypothetical protein
MIKLKKNNKKPSESTDQIRDPSQKTGITL